MQTVDVKTIQKAVYDLCYQANTKLSGRVYSKILKAYNQEKDENLKTVFSSILENAKIATNNKRPLCQDTGQVLLFLSVGQDVHISGGDLNDAINSAVEKCYRENFFRKSVVKDALLSRENTKTNTPVIIYSEIVPGQEIKIDVLIKGAGSENKSKADMLLPTYSKEDIIEYIAKCVLDSGTSACPPLFVGVGIGGTFDKAVLLSKKALLIEDSKNPELTTLEKEITDYINQNAPERFSSNYVLDLKVITSSTHIACMPVAVCINCHSSREASCVIDGDNIIFQSEEYDLIDTGDDLYKGIKEIFADDVERIRALKEGEQVLLSGEVFVARDAAHFKMLSMMNDGESLPFDLKNSIIFYAGPCPSAPGEVIGPIGPTTSSRMDKFAATFYDNGVMATIGKGERNAEIKDSIKKNRGVYFSAIGGISSLLASKIKKAEVIAFEELGAEAIYKIEIDKLPLRVDISAQ